MVCNRMVIMVILNASIGILLKAFLVYAPINDLINSIRYLKIDPIEYYQSDAIFGTVPLCSYEAVCHAIEELTNRLFVSSFFVYIAVFL